MGVYDLAILQCSSALSTGGVDRHADLFKPVLSNNFFKTERLDCFIVQESALLKPGLNFKTPLGFCSLALGKPIVARFRRLDGKLKPFEQHRTWTVFLQVLY